MFVTRTAFVTGSGPYTDSILGKNIDSFLATTSSQSRVHPLSHAVVLDIGVNLLKHEADNLYLVRRSKTECDLPPCHLHACMLCSGQLYLK
jgi:hypothetical protein